MLGNENKQGQSLAILPSITFSGKKLAILAVIPGKTIQSLKKYIDSDAHESADKNNSHIQYILSGNRKSWFSEKHIHQYIDDIVLPHTNYNPSLLLLDSARHHITSAVKKHCKSHNINLVIIPPHTTSICQPLDVRIFGIVKPQLQQYTINQREASPNKSSPIHTTFHEFMSYYHRLRPSTIVKAFTTACKPRNSARKTTLDPSSTSKSASH